jgi:hypothetical protein
VLQARFTKSEVLGEMPSTCSMIRANTLEPCNRACITLHPWPASGVLYASVKVFLTAAEVQVHRSNALPRERKWLQAKRLRRQMISHRGGPSRPPLLEDGHIEEQQLNMFTAPYKNSDTA